MKRSFFIGEEWIYYKLYCGEKTADGLLLDLIKPLCNELFNLGLIVEWFFIRYADPNHHIRLRFKLPENDKSNQLVSIVRKRVEPFFQVSKVWRIQTDTYQRELERYGETLIEETEELFCIDSNLVLMLIDFAKNHGDEKFRWLMALKVIDVYLDAVGITEPSKKMFMVNEMKKFVDDSLFNDASLKQQIFAKYKSNRDLIKAIINDASKLIEAPAKEELDKYQLQLRQKLFSIIEIISSNINCPKIEDLVGSYTHMFCNRLFPAQQRIHEFVLYDLLYLNYKESILSHKSEPI